MKDVIAVHIVYPTAYLEDIISDTGLGESGMGH